MTTVAPSDTFSIGGDLPVHRLGYGAMQLPGPGVWGEPADPENARRVVRAAVERGVDFIDTADSYGPVVSERIIAEALHPYPEDLVIATKAGLTRQGPGIWTPVGRPAYLKQQVELSLRTLRLERIDLIQLHRIDGAVPWTGPGPCRGPAGPETGPLRGASTPGRPGGPCPRRRGAAGPRRGSR